MGLDRAEFVIELETEFGGSILDSEAARIRTSAMWRT